MVKKDDIHPRAPAGGGGTGAFRSAATLGRNQEMDKWFRPEPLGIQQKANATSKEIPIPMSPLWHMGKVATYGSKFSFEFLQNTIDYLSSKGKAKAHFNDDEKEFMKELFEALWWGGKAKGLSEAAELANHYVNGKGQPLEIDAEVYKNSVIVSDTMDAMKSYIRKNHNKITTKLTSSDPEFLKSPYAKKLKKGRNQKTQGNFLEGGALKAEENNLRLKNTDNRFYLQIESVKIGNHFTSTWKVESVYDFEPFSKGYFTNIPLGNDHILKLPDGLSNYLTKIGVAQDFDYFAKWTETWD